MRTGAAVSGCAASLWPPCLQGSSCSAWAGPRVASDGQMRTRSLHAASPSPLEGGTRARRGHKRLQRGSSACAGSRVPVPPDVPVPVPCQGFRCPAVLLARGQARGGCRAHCGAPRAARPALQWVPCGRQGQCPQSVWAGVRGCASSFWKETEAAACLCPMALASGLASGCSPDPPALNPLSQRLLQFPPGCLRPGSSCRMLLCWGPPGPHLQPPHGHLSPPIHLLPSFGSVCSMLFIGAN